MQEERYFEPPRYAGRKKLYGEEGAAGDRQKGGMSAVRRGLSLKLGEEEEGGEKGAGDPCP